jgi:predicted NBD/HSP70 family sugar kinase
MRRHRNGHNDGSRIGRHLADLVNLIDPGVIVVGGESVQFAEALLGPIREAMEQNVFFAKPPFLPDWAPGAWARGAAALATQNIFDFERSPSRVAVLSEIEFRGARFG